MTGREAHQAVFIVRLVRDPTGRVTGVVERVRTGEKARVAALEEIGTILAEMLGLQGARDEKGGSSIKKGER